MDRIDLHLEVPALHSTEMLANTSRAETSPQIRERTVRARQIQRQRFQNAGIHANAHMNHRQIKQYCSLDEGCKKLLKAAIDELGLSARGYDKILKISRTIADLAGEEALRAEPIAEAIQYRSLDRNWRRG